MPNNVLDSGLQESRKSTKLLCSGNRKRERGKKKTHRISGNTFYVLKRKINQD